MSKMDIILLDSSNNTKETKNITKPNTYQEFLLPIRQIFNNLSEYYELYILDSKNQTIIINNKEKYNLIEDILYIHEIEKDILGKSTFDINYNILSESKRDILEEKYSCILCTLIIKKELPYFCYKCQKIFHQKCIKDWDRKCQEQSKILSCPNCRYELPIEKWNKKLNYEEERKDNANLLNKENKYQLNNNMLNSINFVKDKKINALKQSENKQLLLINKYESYINETIEIFKTILEKIKTIHLLLKMNKSNKLDNLINMFPLTLKNLDITEISNIINEELECFEIKIMKNHQNGNEINSSEKKNHNFKLSNLTMNSSKDNKIMMQNFFKKDSNFSSMRSGDIKFKLKLEGKVNNFILDENEISIIYNTKFKDDYNIFGEQFVENNKDKIELVINGKNKQLMANCQLQKGENIITIKIKEKLNDLSYMFNWCDSLKDIKGLKNLDVKDITNFSYMFYGCSSLSDITPLQNWNISKGIDFSGMFCSCKSLSDLNPLKNWNFSKGIYFAYMFSGCSSLSDLKPLKNWDVSNGIDFSFLFSECSSLSDIKPLRKWNVAKGNNFYHMFYECSSLLDLSTLQQWDISQLDISYVK